MRSIVAAVLILSTPIAAHAYNEQPMPPGTKRMSGIVDRAPPGTTRVPGVVSVRIGAADPVVSHDLRQAHRNIERRRENGELSHREARQLRREVRLTARLGERYGYDGLSETERRELRLRASVLRSQSAAPPRRR